MTTEIPHYNYRDSERLKKLLEDGPPVQVIKTDQAKEDAAWNGYAAQCAEDRPVSEHSFRAGYGAGTGDQLRVVEKLKELIYATCPQFLKEGKCSICDGQIFKIEQGQ